MTIIMKKEKNKYSREDIIQFINMKLISLGFEPVIRKSGPFKDATNKRFLKIAENLIQNYRSKSRLLNDYYCPADIRINNFLEKYFKDIDFVEQLKVPSKSFILDQEGIARELSLPMDKNEFKTDLIESYRIQQGVLHNPAHDRRTTKGSFHIVEGGLPIPLEKYEVPKETYARLFREAVNPPEELMGIPFSSTNKKNKANSFVSLLVRPIVCPEVKDFIKEKTMEVRFFVPGNFVSNLDFVESIFGNAGNPNHSKNDAALDVEHWTGHTGCVILAPHLTSLKKKDVGLPHYDDATERQRANKMCWKDENELYNEGSPFKLTCRDERGVAVTLIADNYFGYSKKEIKTMISYSANLFGLVEEEHAGGAVAFPRKNIGTRFEGELFIKKFPKDSYTFEKIKERYADLIDFKSENYGIDKKYSNIIYIPENATIDLFQGTVEWKYREKNHSLKVSTEYIYIYPTGHQLHMEKTAGISPSWRIVSTEPEGTFCHKPFTVSGGGKSEISKSLLNAVITMPFTIEDIDKDFDLADEIIQYDYSKRWKEGFGKPDNRVFLAKNRTLGSAIKLLTPSEEYTEEYNKMLSEIPRHIKSLVLFVKRFYRPERHKTSWREFFTVDIVNGKKGRELMFNDRKILGSYVRVGFAPNGSWYLHKLRTDFIPAAKIQMEDDITASIVVPASCIKNLHHENTRNSLKLVANCERKFFQRPDEAIHRGYDKDAERDLSLQGNFTSNYEPMTSQDAQELIEYVVEFDKYTKPIQDLIKKGAQNKDMYFITPSHTRVLEDGSRSTNPRYLQTRPDIIDPEPRHTAKMGLRFSRLLSSNEHISIPIDAVLPGRRNNPSDKANGIRPLSVYNPIHFQELPELFMDVIASLTGKSPSTTGAGTEGALTKAPFNMLTATTDLNNALISYILTGYNGFSSAAGYVGVNNRFDHDISLLIPEIWSRIIVRERNPQTFIKEKAMEKLEDFEYNGKKVLASRLGYRITANFLFKYMNRVFNEPQAVFTEEMLKPELQSMEDFVDGINNIVEAQERVAINYFKDGSVASAIPPLKVLLHIMAYGHYEGKEISDPELRKLFTYDYVINSDWYQERLKLKQSIDIEYTNRFINYINDYLANPKNVEVNKELKLEKRLEKAQKHLKYYESDKYLKDLNGTIGADVLYKKNEEHNKY